ncbi:30S ribosomal protein S2, partial [Candidatus Parcubacteria bacterium]|nr:30S ribosomal protein S2 [Candidatus Parcubacteria bacterium]
PKLLVVIDPKKEQIAITEARRMRVPIVALAGSDTNLHQIDRPIPGNDASRQTISYVLGEVVSAYKRGLAAKADRDKEKNDIHGTN